MNPKQHEPWSGPVNRAEWRKRMAMLPRSLRPKRAKLFSGLRKTV